MTTAERASTLAGAIIYTPFAQHQHQGVGRRSMYQSVGRRSM